MVRRDGCVGQHLPPIWPVPTGYRLARLLTASRSRLNAEERIFVSHLLAEEPALDAAITWAKRLNKLLRRRAVESLDDVLTAAGGTLFARFAASLRRDFDAISAALVTPWTTSPVEGQIQPPQDAEAHHVRAGWVRAAPRASAESDVSMPATRGLRESQNAGATDSRSGAGLNHTEGKAALSGAHQSASSQSLTTEAGGGFMGSPDTAAVAV